jgi:hypothetical protein
MIQYTSDDWTGCLLNKLGFDYSDLFIKFGMPDNIYDSSIAMSSNVKFRYQKVSPITTHPIIGISSSIDLSEQDYTKKNSAGSSEPLFSLSIGTLIPVNLDGSNSENLLPIFQLSHPPRSIKFTVPYPPMNILAIPSSFKLLVYVQRNISRATISTVRMDDP